MLQKLSNHLLDNCGIGVRMVLKELGKRKCMPSRLALHMFTIQLISIIFRYLIRIWCHWISIGMCWYLSFLIWFVVRLRNYYLYVRLVALRSGRGITIVQLLTIQPDVLASPKLATSTKSDEPLSNETAYISYAVSYWKEPDQRDFLSLQ